MEKRAESFPDCTISNDSRAMRYKRQEIPDYQADTPETSGLSRRRDLLCASVSLWLVLAKNFLTTETQRHREISSYLLFGQSPALWLTVFCFSVPDVLRDDPSRAASRACCKHRTAAAARPSHRQTNSRVSFPSCAAMLTRLSTRWRPTETCRRVVLLFVVRLSGRLYLRSSFHFACGCHSALVHSSDADCHRRS